MQMAFDRSAFMRAEYSPRTRVVRVISEALKRKFDEGDAPEFTIQSLNGDQIARTHEARERNISREALLRALASSKAEPRGEAVSALLNVNDEETPADIARRLEVLVQGAVEPAVDLDMAIRIKTVAGVDFFNITNEILALSGEGYDEKKS